MSVYEELEFFSNTWDKAKVRTSGDYENLPDGKYQVSIDVIRFENAKTSGRLQLAWMLKVVAPDAHKNRKVFHYRGLDKPEAVEWMKQDLFNCGLDVDEIGITDLPTMLPKLLDRIIEVTLKTKKGRDGTDFQNCYINRLLNEGLNFRDDDETIPF